MEKPLTFCEACGQLDFTKDNLYHDGDENKEDLIKDDDSLWE